MNRYTYALKSTGQNTGTIIGLFPWGTIVDPATTDHKKSQISFYEHGVDFLRQLAGKNISVVLFLNQFKPHVLPMDDLKNFADSVEQFVRDQGVAVLGMYWCPGVEKKDPFVVPNPGMFVRVTENIGIDWNKIPVLSSSEVDLSAATKVKATPVMIGAKHNKYTSYSNLADWVSSI
jgi:histidinol phosphatase-like enzyme